MKVAILVDRIVNKGGTERIILTHAKHYNADIYVGKYNPDTTFKGFEDCNVIPLLPNKPHSSFDTIRTWLKFRKIELNYDFYFLQGIGALNAAKNCKPNLWYCHSPSRYLYDLYLEELEKRKGISRLFYEFVTSVMRSIDKDNVKHVDKVVTNSINIKNRLNIYHDFDKVGVIYPFVDLDKFKFIKHGDFFLSTGRLDPIKRIDLIIKAFQKIPNKKLLVVSTGPDEDKLKKMCQGYKNIKMLGSVSEERLYELYGKCKAAIYLSYKEDFGLVPIEAMACGKPCIATNEGGFKETIIHKKTGYLVDNPTNPVQVIEAIKWMTKDRAKEMRTACEKRSKLFSKESHLDKFTEEMQDE